jgi:hypothetical protein
MGTTLATAAPDGGEGGGTVDRERQENAQAHGGEPAQAIWSVDMNPGTVKYVNEYAKIFSWAPSY